MDSSSSSSIVTFGCVHVIELAMTPTKGDHTSSYHATITAGGNEAVSIRVFPSIDEYELSRLDQDENCKITYNQRLCNMRRRQRNRKDLCKTTDQLQNGQVDDSEVDPRVRNEIVTSGFDRMVFPAPPIQSLIIPARVA